MPFEVVMPRLGWNMETGRLGEWLKRAGEYVEAGETLFTVESDKAIQEVESLESGVLFIPPDAPAPGTEMPVGTLLGYLLAEGEAPPVTAGEPAPAAASPRPTEAGPQTAAPQSAGSGDQLAASGQTAQVTISPRARRVAGELNVDWTALRGSGRTGRIVERDVRQAAAARPPVTAPAAAERISPLARKLAGELHVDVERLAAALPGRRIERADVEAAAAPAASGAPSLAPAPVAEIGGAREGLAAALPAGTAIPISAVRRTIAQRMAASSHTAAPVTLTTEADATELVRVRKQLKEDGFQPLPSYNDLLAKLAAQALLDFPAVNARFEGDTIVQAAAANIGIAVDTDRGLLVPVLPDVQNKSLRQVARESLALIERTRAGRATPADLQGGTFTITNLGMFEIDAFTPIINLPECAILGVGRIVPKQVVVDVESERVAIRHMLFLSLTFDHRLVDGAPAARFLQRVKQYVEKPYLWLAG